MPSLGNQHSWWRQPENAGRPSHGPSVHFPTVPWSSGTCRPVPVSPEPEPIRQARWMHLAAWERGDADEAAHWARVIVRAKWEEIPESLKEVYP
jgi:hypothetical protein